MFLLFFKRLVFIIELLQLFIEGGNSLFFFLTLWKLVKILKFLFGLFDFSNDFLNHYRVLGFDKVEHFFPYDNTIVENFFRF